jgi:hypothetical protein
MNQEEYTGKLQIALSQAIHQYVSSLDSIDVKGYLIKIASVEDVYVTANMDSISLDRLLSGSETEVGGEGTIILFESVEGVSSSRGFNFRVRNAQVKFDSPSQQFQVIDIGQLVPLGFSR